MRAIVHEPAHGNYPHISSSRRMLRSISMLLVGTGYSRKSAWCTRHAFGMVIVGYGWPCCGVYTGMSTAGRAGTVQFHLQHVTGSFIMLPKDKDGNLHSPHAFRHSWQCWSLHCTVEVSSSLRTVGERCRPKVDSLCDSDVSGRLTGPQDGSSATRGRPEVDSKQRLDVLALEVVGIVLSQLDRGSTFDLPGVRQSMQHSQVQPTSISTTRQGCTGISPETM